MACAALYSRCVHITFKAISWAYSSSVPSYGPLPHVQLIGIFEHVAQWHMVPGPNMWARVNLASWTVSFESMMMRRLGPIQAESVLVQPRCWIPELQYSTVQNSSVQYSTVQGSTVDQI